MDGDTPKANTAHRTPRFGDLSTQLVVDLLSPTPTKPPRPKTLAEAMVRRYEGRPKQTVLKKAPPPKKNLRRDLPAPQMISPLSLNRRRLKLPLGKLSNDESRTCSQSGDIARGSAFPDAEERFPSPRP